MNINQCDGCCAYRQTVRRYMGDKVIVLHIMGQYDYPDYMVCQKDKYQ